MIRVFVCAQRAAASAVGKKPPPLHTRAPLGSDVEMDAVVKDTSKVIIKGLMGFWAECSLEEAPAYIAVQTKHLEAQIKKLDKQVCCWAGSCLLVCAYLLFCCSALLYIVSSCYPGTCPRVTEAS